MQPNDVIAGRYRLLRPIGEGATGTVWAAKHELVGREYALKLATVGNRAGDRAARDARELFLREVRIVGALRHKNVVDIADAGEAGDALYLAMELLHGEPLSARIARSPLAPGEALAITADICRGLSAAHAAGVVHRDIKPENVFLTRSLEGEITAKLLDFGVSSARGTSASRLYGTPAYMSPEQALGEADVDHRVDIWAAGVVLYEMLTGQRPFDAESYPALLPIIIDQPYPPLPASIPEAVSAVVARCLAKSRDGRYESADAMLAAIERARAELGAEGPIEVNGAAPERSRSAKRAGSLAAAIAAVALITVLAMRGRKSEVSASVPPPPSVTTAAAIAPNPAPTQPEPTVAPSAAASSAASPSARPSAAPPPASANTARVKPPSPGKGRVTKVDRAGF